MRIGIDARELLGERTGVGQYLAELLRRWTVRRDLDPGTRRFVLYAPETIPFPLPDHAVEHRVVGRGRGTWWEQTALRQAVQRDRLNVFFAPAYTAPLGLRIPVAVTIHDVSFVAHPEWFRFREGLRRRWLTRRSAATAAVVFTDSAFSRREIERHLRVPAARIRVIPPGVTLRSAERASGGVRERLVLYVGSIFTRRRLPQLLEAFAQVAAALDDAALVIVGDNRTWPPQDLPGIAERLGITRRVRMLKYVDDEELGSLYGRAAVFAFLSEYEGFGLTPLEALAAGVPIVVLDTPVAREVYGPGATYVAAGDVAGTAAALRSFLEVREGSASPMPEAGEVLSRYSWDRAADDTLAEIERIAVG